MVKYLKYYLKIIMNSLERVKRMKLEYRDAQLQVGENLTLKGLIQNILLIDKNTVASP